MENKDEFTQNFINNLITVKDEFIKNKQELAVSIRKDVVAVQLKDILESNSDYYTLKTGIESYIQSLYTFNKEESDENYSR